MNFYFSCQYNLLVMLEIYTNAENIYVKKETFDIYQIQIDLYLPNTL